MIEVRRSLQFALLGLALAGCGYFQAGSWEDDPKNWRRAFGESPPPGVEVSNSLYKRYPHFTHEHKMFFRFEAPREFVERMIERFELHRPEEAGDNARDPSTPEWFAPLSLEHYEIWTSGPNCALFRSRDSDVTYFTHTQL